MTFVNKKLHAGAYIHLHTHAHSLSAAAVAVVVTVQTHEVLFLGLQQHKQRGVGWVQLHERCDDAVTKQTYKSVVLP